MAPVGCKRAHTATGTWAQHERLERRKGTKYGPYTFQYVLDGHFGSLHRELPFRFGSQTWPQAQPQCRRGTVCKQTRRARTTIEISSLETGWLFLNNFASTAIVAAAVAMVNARAMLPPEKHLQVYLVASSATLKTKKNLMCFLSEFVGNPQHDYA